MTPRGSNPSGHARPVKLGLLAAAPMYYQAPLYRRLAADPRLDFKAMFASSGGVREHDAGYGQPVTWDVDALGGFQHSFLARAGVNPIDGPFFSLRDPDIVTQLLRERFDVLWVHGYNYLTHMLAVATQRIRGGKLLLREEQNLLHPRGPVKTVLKEASLRALFSQVQGLYIGTENRRWFEHYGVPSERLAFCPYCVDNARLRRERDQLAPHRPDIQRRLGIEADSGPVVLMLSRLIPKKQPLFALEAFRLARSKAACTLLVVGSGEELAEMKRKVAEERIPDVLFAGFLPQSRVSEAYVAADIFTLLSRERETWGLVVNEAMNFRLPVVLSNKVGCGADLVRHGGNGYVVSHTDPHQAASRLVALVSDPRLRSQMGLASSELIDDWNYDRTADGVVGATSRAVAPDRWASASQLLQGETGRS